ncbi:MAG: Mrp/NBP35 family ATP-binding protein [Armatimonadetes bacterium]|nr:Mrp/NBP35 family ATP-binding protein [Armatimonadota bacterium]
MSQDLDPLILASLSQIVDPDLGRDIVSLGFVKSAKIESGIASAVIELTTPACPVKEEMQAEAERLLAAIPGVGQVKVQMTARVREKAGMDGSALPGVKHIVAIASGKGGVGKSTISVNLAVALAESGAKTGLLDADIYGPSIPMMMGAENQKPHIANDKMQPIRRYGVSLMSLGFLLEEGQAAMWRGPIVAGTVRQLFQDVEWGELDYLLVDLPPGTGDAPLTVAQGVPLSGVVVVMTPQDVAASIAAKSAILFQRLEAPILGVVENMASFKCPCCGEISEIFPGRGAQAIAERLEVPFLGSIPLDPDVSRSSDAGKPAVVAMPLSDHAQALKSIAQQVAAQISIRTAQNS